jgi:drug/metabolite transporter (DMT)-like permease
MTTGFAFILSGVVLNATAQLLLKAGTNAIGRFEYAAPEIGRVALRFAVEPHIAAGVACYVVSLVVWLLGLSRVEVSVAYPMLSLGYVINALGAAYLLGEMMTPMRIVGIGAIILGVLLVARS